MRLSAFILASLLVGSFTTVPELDARGRTNNANGNRPSSSVSSTPSVNSRPNNNRPNNPGNNNYRPNNPGNNNNRPNNPGTNNNRPNNPGNNNNRPNNPGNNNYRPNNPGNNNYRPNNPGNNNRPTPPPPGGLGNQGNYRPNPGPGPQPNYYHHRPERPHFPHSYNYYRPTPPPAWRPSGPVPVLNAILGITFGTALNLSMNSLLANGYNVAGYGPSEIYLNNVSQFNYYWPDATMYYSNGRLVGSSFAYATLGYDMSRYNRLYNNFMGMYGAPVAVQNMSNGGIQATWWGYNNAYITLSYYPDYTPNGALRYYTTVSLGR